MGLNALQQYALNLMIAGYNVFITGGAGVGKTEVIKTYIRHAQSENYNVMVCAAHGIAALNIDGVTLHRAFNAPLEVITTTDYKDIPNETLLNTDILIIDEVSPCRIDLFDYTMYNVANANRRRRARGLHNIQLIISGDFFQLPPVMTKIDKIKLDTAYKRDVKNAFAFNSVYWNVLDLKYVVLTEVMRQKDAIFLSYLNRLRTGDAAGIQYLVEHSHKEYIPDAITLCGTNNEVNAINEREMAKIPGEEISILGDISGKIKEEELPVDATLRLKIGAKVIILRNATDGSYANGSIGYLEEVSSDYVRIRTDRGDVLVTKEKYSIYDYEVRTDEQGENVLHQVEIGSLVQFPIKLAYAITIHKSQGMTYDDVNIDPYAWDCGQLYVALSRVKSLEKMHFMRKIDYRYLVVSLDVIQFYNGIVAKANQYVDTSVRLIEKKHTKIDNADLAKVIALMKNI